MRKVILTIIVAAFVLGLSYLIISGLVWCVFWAFGSTIYGYTFSFKIVLGVWAGLVILRSIIGTNKK